jgi:hypothetical protein
MDSVVGKMAAGCTCCQHDKSLPSSSTVRVCPWKMGPTGCLETSVKNYQSTLCNVPEERRSQITTQLGVILLRKTKKYMQNFRALGILPDRRSPGSFYRLSASSRRHSPLSSVPMDIEGC